MTQMKSIPSIIRCVLLRSGMPRRGFCLYTVHPLTG